VRQYNIPPGETATEFSVAVFSLEVVTVKVYYLSIICFVTLALAIKSTCLCSELIYQDNPNIQITCNNIEYDGSILIEGTSPNLNRVWAVAVYNLPWGAAQNITIIIRNSIKNINSKGAI
jgi:hypothetical protein